MSLPDLPPYAPENQDLPSPPPGQVLSKFPFDQKHLQDAFWWDTLGRTLIEQRKILTVPRSDEEKVSMVEQALKDCQDLHDENDEDPTEEMLAEDLDARIQSIALEAAIKGSPAVMRYLVEKYGLHADKSDDGLCLIMHVACKNGFPSVLEVLVDQAGVDVQVQDDSDETTPLYMAAINGQAETAKWLLDRGAKYTLDEEHPGGLFSAATFSGDVATFETMVAAAKEREPEIPASAWANKPFVLGCAAQSGSLAMMQYIAELGGYGKANENTEEQRKAGIKAIPLSIRNSSKEQTCLDMAIDIALQRNGDGSFVKSDDPYLIEHLSSATVNCPNRDKTVILEKILQLILDATTITAESDAFKDILHEAVHYCKPPSTEPSARILLEKWGASPNINDSEGSVPYSLALAQSGVDSQDVEYLKFWLKHGADIHRAWGPYCNGPTAMARAIELKLEAIAIELLAWGGPVDRVESGLATRKKVWAVISDDELQSVELVASEPEDAADRCVCLTFNDEMTADWLHKIQIRRSDNQLAEDGSGRPLKSRE